MLNVSHIGVEIDHKKILNDVCFELNRGDVLMVIGPNGSGKTTLVRAIMNMLPSTGGVTLYGKDARKLPARELAARVGVLTQNNNIQFDFDCYELVSVGRYAHRKGFSTGLSKADRQAVDEAFDMTKTSHLKHRLVTTLSGGELQRVCLARTFAQKPDILILDEPTNHLDIEHQLSIFEIISAWAKEGDHAVLSIIHDLNLAYSYGTHALLLAGGRQIAYGAPKDVLTSENLKRIYNVDLVAWMKSLLEKW